MILDSVLFVGLMAMVQASSTELVSSSLGGGQKLLVQDCEVKCDPLANGCRLGMRLPLIPM